MLPRRLSWLAEMNHPSAFFCKPSITSDFSPQTPTPARRHTYLHTHIRRGYGAKSHRGWVVLTNQLRLCENTAPLYPAPLCLSAFLFSPDLPSHSHISLYLSCHSSFLLCFPFLHISSVSRSSSPPHCAGRPQWLISLPCFAGQLSAQHQSKQITVDILKGTGSNSLQWAGYVEAPFVQWLQHPSRHYHLSLVWPAKRAG